MKSWGKSSQVKLMNCLRTNTYFVIIFEHDVNTCNVIFIVFPRDLNISVLSKPTLLQPGFDFMVIQWNTSDEFTGKIAMYVVHVQLNTSGLDSLRLPPYVQSYALVNSRKI